MIAFAVIKILDVVIGSIKGCLYREREREKAHAFTPASHSPYPNGKS